MAVPAVTVRIDWDNDGDFLDAYENLSTGRVLGASWTRGRSADFSAEAIGSATIVLRNDDDLYTPDGASGPTAAQLVPGRPVHIYATYSAVDYPQFYGYIERLEYDPSDRTVTITCYDPLRRLSETDVVVPANTYAAHSARTMRRAVLEDFERGTRNLITNPSFETNTTGWTQTGTSLTRTATDAAPGAGSAYGAFIAASSGQHAYAYARLAPVFFEGETYRFSVYLKVASGTATWKVGLGTTLGASADEISVTATTTWTRFTVTHTLAANQTASGATPLVAWVESTAAGTVRIDAAAVTRGQALYPYADSGTGRWPSWVGNGDFEGLSAGSGWSGTYKNLVGNPGFEVDATGWVNATRSTTAPYLGVGHGSVLAATAATYNLTGTFKAGTEYHISVVWRAVATGSNGTFYLGSAGTPGDRSASAPSVGTTYTQNAWTWTPSADRTDAQISLTGSAAFYIDAVMVQSHAFDALYFDTGPGGGGVPPTSQAIGLFVVGTPIFGRQALVTVTPATALAGTLYDFQHYGSMFVSGQLYSASITLYPVSVDMPYKVGIAAVKSDGSYDESTPATGTATADTPTRITVTWTPSGDRTTVLSGNVVLYVMQTDATARTFYVDGARVTPGAVDDFEMSRWVLDNSYGGETNDQYLGTASFDGSALSALSTLNTLTLTRHWVSPETASPFYTYVTEDRVTFAAKVSVETYDDDLHDMTAADVDRAAIVNIVPVSWNGGLEYYSDAESVGMYGPRPTGAIGGSAFFPDRTTPDIIGPALVTRYRDPHARPEITVQNRWPSQLVRELNDMVTVNFSPLLIAGREYVILRLTTTVGASGNLWTTVYALEEVP